MLPRLRTARLGGDDSGQVLVLVIGLAVIAALLVTVVVDASKAFLFRRSLSAWADGAALTAAQRISEPAVYGAGGGDTLPLSQADAQAAVADYVARNDLAGRYDGFAVTGVAVAPDTGTVTVGFSARVALPFVNVVSGDNAAGVPIWATAAATAPLE